MLFDLHNYSNSGHLGSRIGEIVLQVFVNVFSMGDSYNADREDFVMNFVHDAYIPKAKTPSVGAALNLDTLPGGRGQKTRLRNTEATLFWALCSRRSMVLRTFFFTLTK